MIDHGSKIRERWIAELFDKTTSPARREDIYTLLYGASGMSAAKRRLLAGMEARDRAEQMGTGWFDANGAYHVPEGE